MARGKAHSIVGDRPENRPEHDFYPTPPDVTEALFAVESFRKNIWEPACGNGAMVEVMKAHNHTVIYSDIKDYGFHKYGQMPILDFVKHEEDSVFDKPCEYDIVTNPPFKLFTEFAVRCHRYQPEKFALFGKLSALEGLDRSQALMYTGLTRVHIFRRRVKLTRNGDHYHNGGMIAFAWYVWERGNSNPPQIYWI